MQSLITVAIVPSHLVKMCRLSIGASLCGAFVLLCLIWLLHFWTALTVLSMRVTEVINAKKQLIYWSLMLSLPTTPLNFL